MERTLELISGYERLIKDAIKCKRSIGVILHDFMLEAQGKAPTTPKKSKFMEEWEAIHKKIKIDYMKVPDGICEVIAYLAELTDKQLSEIIDRVALIERTYVIKEKE